MVGVTTDAGGIIHVNPHCTPVHETGCNLVIECDLLSKWGIRGLIGSSMGFDEPITTGPGRDAIVPSVTDATSGAAAF